MKFHSCPCVPDTFSLDLFLWCCLCQSFNSDPARDTVWSFPPWWCSSAQNSLDIQLEDVQPVCTLELEVQLRINGPISQSQVALSVHHVLIHILCS